MLNWNDISLFKFQAIDAINAKKELDDFDRVMYSACAIYGISEYELNNYSKKKALKIISEINVLNQKAFDPKPSNRIGKYYLNYDISKMTFGQYIEVSFFVTDGVRLAHYILASISHKSWRKVKTEEHREKADYFLNKPVLTILGCVKQLNENLKAFNNEYATLFGIDPEIKLPKTGQGFNKRYGWTYSASQVAEYERITLEQAFNLPVRQALNDLAYLKALGNYQLELSKQK